MRLPMILVLSALLFQQEPQTPFTLHVNTQLVMVPFHVVQKSNFVTDLKASDVILLEDGKPREFTIFDSPETQGRLPLELVLLFDTNPMIPDFWDPNGVFTFVSQWKDEMSRDIFDSTSTDIRVSVYRCSGKLLYKVLAATKDSHQLGNSLRGLLTEAAKPDTVVIPLSLPEQRNGVGRGPFTDEYVTSYFISAESRGWPMEAGIEVLNDLASSEKVSRVVVMFSEGIGATTTIPKDLGNHALDLGIPFFPIVTNYEGHITSEWPRNFFRMKEFASLGKMTGGRAIEYKKIDAQRLVKTLQTVKADGLSQYVVGFSPKFLENQQKQHTLEVRMAPKSKGTVEGGTRRAAY